jgi:hypothetical protein
MKRGRMPIVSNIVWTDAVLIEKLIWFRNEFNRQPQATDCCSRNKMPSRSMYQKRFGSFNSAMEKAGLPIIKSKSHFGTNRKYTNEQLFEHIRNVIIKIGHIPSAFEYEVEREKGTPPAETICGRFKSFEGALRASGIKFSLIRYKLRMATKQLHSLAVYSSGLLTEKIDVSQLKKES